MKSMIKTLLLGLVLFGLSATASYFLLTPEAPSTAKHGDDEHDKKSEDHGKEADSHGEAEHHPANQDAFKMSPPEHKEHAKAPATQTPVSFQPEKGLTVEALMQLSESIRKRDQLLNERAAVIDKNEERSKMIFKDLEQERSELDAFSQQIDQKIELAKQLLESLKAERAALATERQELASLKKPAPTNNPAEPAAGKVDVVGKMTKWFKEIEPSTAARYLKELANGGDLELAAEVMMKLDQAAAAEILTKLDDPALARQLINAAMKK